MPTGYTAELMEKGQTFQQFIMGCARAFGALITMRDDSSDTPIPEKFEPTDYHVKKIEEATTKLDRLKAMSDKEKVAFGQKEKSAAIKQNEQWLKKEMAENKRLGEMEAQVRAWRPPTPDHKSLKDFMLQQIGTSKNSLEYIETHLKDARDKTPMAYYIAAVSDAARDIKYHTEENEKEVERVNGRNEWLKQLRNSI